MQACADQTHSTLPIAFPRLRALYPLCSLCSLAHLLTCLLLARCLLSARRLNSPLLRRPSPPHRGHRCSFRCWARFIGSALEEGSSHSLGVCSTRVPGGSNPSWLTIIGPFLAFNSLLAHAINKSLPHSRSSIDCLSTSTAFLWCSSQFACPAVRPPAIRFGTIELPGRNWAEANSPRRHDFAIQDVSGGERRG